ncbi:hypothetical protein [Massilia yuzhufengensis]|uniref:Uncharacterized protein n=1 Tax=Massilia yuzhufengensis TaxID=1164594 RepID=A0A1I1NCU7_9BURK|nr:hypothetical protein [Massilia yuzhufengensis]SFC95459.1 hypothetical protein SAMN05216204_11332 [Massilia yuzhufengensis]
MDANQRSEVNNQNNNGANEKGRPGAQGITGSGPLDHTYPKGAGSQQAGRGEDGLQGAQDPSRMGRQQVAAEDGGQAGMEAGLAHPVGSDLPGGSMQSQQTGGSGPQQGITDSHQRQMEQHSGAWGLLEQPVGRRDRHSGTDVHTLPPSQQGNSQAARTLNPQDPRHPELQAAEGNRQRLAPDGQGTGMAIGPTSKQEKP